MSRKHIIFDFDGVIGDTFAINWELVQQLHPEVTEKQYRITHHLGNVFAEPAVPFTAESSTAYYDFYNAQLSVAHIAAALPTLKKLGDIYRLHVVSSNCESAIGRVLNEGGVADYFGHILGKEAHESKVQKFNHIAQEEHFSLSDALFVTDTLGDIKEAHRASLPTLAVTFGYHPLEVVVQGMPEMVAHSWTEVGEKAAFYLQ